VAAMDGDEGEEKGSDLIDFHFSICFDHANQVFLNALLAYGGVNHIVSGYNERPE
jgi:hypothetical protein